MEKVRKEVFEAVNELEGEVVLSNGKKIIVREFGPKITVEMDNYYFYIDGEINSVVTYMKKLIEKTPFAEWEEGLEILTDRILKYMEVI